MNWLQQQASKADPSKDIVIIENPEVRNDFDKLLTTTFAPKIWELLMATGYKVLPEKPEPSSNLSYALVRKLDFMLFDYQDYMFFRGAFTVSQNGWMFERTFSLGLPQTTNPDLMLRIIGDSRFSGMPPTLEIQKSDSRPAWDTYFFITFKAGKGTSWGTSTIYDHALTSVESVIAASQQMYFMAMADMLSTQADVEKFLTVAAIGYGVS